MKGTRFFEIIVHRDDSSVTLLVPRNITYGLLISLVDFHVARHMHLNESISNNTAKLCYMDEDSEFVRIDGDEDIQEMLRVYCKPRNGLMQQEAYFYGGFPDWNHLIIGVVHLYFFTQNGNGPYCSG